MPRFSAFNYPYYYPYYRNYNNYRNYSKSQPAQAEYEKEKSSTTSTTKESENENSNRVVSSSSEEPKNARHSGKTDCSLIVCFHLKILFHL